MLLELDLILDGVAQHWLVLVIKLSMRFDIYPRVFRGRVLPSFSK